MNLLVQPAFTDHVKDLLECHNDVLVFLRDFVNQHLDELFGGFKVVKCVRKRMVSDLGHNDGGDVSSSPVQHVRPQQPVYIDPYQDPVALVVVIEGALRPQGQLDYFEDCHNSDENEVDSIRHSARLADQYEQVYDSEQD